MGKVIFSASRGNAAIASGNYQLSRTFDPYQRKHSQRKKAHFVVAGRFTEGALEVIGNAIGNLVAGADAVSEIFATFRSENIESKCHGGGYLHHGSRKIGGLMNGRGNGGAEGVGCYIGFEHRNIAFSAVKQNTFIVNTQSRNILTGS
jgi:hypothetical protein